MSVDNMNGKAVLDLAGMVESDNGDPWMEITIKRRGKVIYRNRGMAGIMCVVQSVDTWTRKEIEGDSQTLIWGPQPLIWFAYHQFEMKTKKYLKECHLFLSAMYDRVKFFKKKRREIMKTINDNRI